MPLVVISVLVSIIKGMDFTVGRSSRQAASDISWDIMVEKAERDLEKKDKTKG